MGICELNNRVDLTNIRLKREGSSCTLMIGNDNTCDLTERGKIISEGDTTIKNVEIKLASNLYKMGGVINIR
jgi:hypothetical protein